MIVRVDISVPSSCSELVNNCDARDGDAVGCWGYCSVILYLNWTRGRQEKQTRVAAATAGWRHETESAGDVGQRFVLVGSLENAGTPAG